MIIGIVIGIVILLVTIITLSILAATGVFNGSSESYDSPPNPMPSPPSPNQDPTKKINLYQTYYDKSLIPRKVYDNIKTYANNLLQFFHQRYKLQNEPQMVFQDDQKNRP